MKEGILSKVDETAINYVRNTNKVTTGADWTYNDTDFFSRWSNRPNGTPVIDTVATNGDESNGGVEGITTSNQLLREKNWKIYQTSSGGEINRKNHVCNNRK